MPHAAAITLLPARPADALEIARLSRDLIEHGLPWTWGPARIQAAIRDPDTVVLVARAGPELAGFAVMTFHLHHAHLSLIAVAPRRQRSGVGRRLLAWLEESALVAGTEWIDLEVRARNDGARAFYEHLGYLQREYVPGYYRGRESALRMRRRLRARSPT